MNLNNSENSGRIVYVGRDSYIYAARVDSAQHDQLTWDWYELETLQVKSLGWAKIQKDFRERKTREQLFTFSCPTWSPAGKIACIGYQFEGNPDSRYAPTLMAGTGIYVIDPASQEIRKIYQTAPGETPFYLMWTPDNENLAFLSQKTSLHLNLSSDSRTAKTIESLVTGAPCFFAISPDSRYLLVHVGGSYRYSLLSRLLIFDLAEIKSGLSPYPSGDISLVPAAFCAPAWSYNGSYISYAAQGPEETDTIYISDREGKDRRVVTQFRGKSAFLWAPNSLKLAFSVAATEDQSSLYEGLNILDLSGNVADTPIPFRLLEEDLVAFFWSPQGDQIVYTLYNPVEECFEWHAIDVLKYHRTQIASFVPNEEMLLLFSFFDQYAKSHPLISPDGQYLAYAGYEDWDHRMSETAFPKIFVAPLNLATPPYEIAEGRFASWSHPQMTQVQDGTL